MNNENETSLMNRLQQTIRELEETKQKLEERERYLRTFFELDPECVTTITEDGILLQMNAAGLRMIEADSLDQVRNTSILHLILPEHRTPFAELVDNVFDGKSGTLEFEITGLKGTRRWLETHAVPLWNNTKEPTELLAITRDITEHRRTKESLAYDSRLWNTLMDTIPDTIYFKDRESRFTKINNAQAKILKLTSVDECIGKTDRNYFSAEHANESLADELQVMRTGNPLIGKIERMKLVDGEERWFSTTKMPHRDQHGNIIGTIGSSREITDFILEQKSRRQSEDQLSKIFHASPAGISITTLLDGRILNVNESFSKMFGYTREEVLGKSVFELNLWTEPLRREDLVKKIQHSGSIKDLEIPLRKKSGELGTTLASVELIELHGKQCLLTVFQNITERRRAERLQETLYLIAQAADSSSSLQAYYATVHEIVRQLMPAENFYIALYDQSQDLLSFPYFVDEADKTAPAGSLGKGLTAYVLRTGKPLLCDEARSQELEKQGEAELIGAPSPIWLGVPLKIENSTIGVMVVQHYSQPTAYSEYEQHILEFISSQVAKAIHRKLAQEALTESEERYRNLVENARDVIFTLSTSGMITSLNPQFETLTGWKRSEWLNKQFEYLIHKDDLLLAWQLFNNSFEGRSAPIVTLRISSKSGDYLTTEITSTPQVSDGKVIGVLGIARDISERKKLEAQLLRTQRMESIGTLASGIAHDLNNVLAPIMMAADILKKQIVDVQTQRILSTIETSAKRGAHIVKQVLTFARGMEGERMLLQPRHLVKEIETLIGETFPKSVTMVTDMPRDLRLVTGNPTELHQVFLNLCVNARDAMPDGGTLKISAENITFDEQYATIHEHARAGEYVAITVADTGIGIAPEVMNRIFDPFFTTKEVGKGTGLGLSTVLGIIKNHNGFINVYSEVGKGTEFKIYLPSSESTRLEFAHILEKGFPQGNGELILIVDDEVSICEITKTTLETNGYKTIVANDGTEALTKYIQHQSEVRIVFTDIMMPYLDGLATMRALRKINPDVKIIATSGLTENEGLFEDCAPNVIAFLSKPYTAEKLLKTLNATLGGINSTKTQSS